jgi:hypothetical protein
MLRTTRSRSLRITELQLPPPCMNNHTGSLESTVAFVGAQTLANRQSSPSVSLGNVVKSPRHILPNCSEVDQNLNLLFPRSVHWCGDLQRWQFGRLGPYRAQQEPATAGLLSVSLRSEAPNTVRCRCRGLCLGTAHSLD